MRPADLHRLASSLFVVGFPGTRSDRDVEALIDGGIAGAILFKRNVESPDQLLALNRSFKQRAGGRPFLCAVDQEGGRVARLRGAPFTELPSMRSLGARGEGAAAAAGRLLGRECRAAGFDWDFAPVVDVDTNPANPVIGDRSFSPDAELVGRLGVALAGGLEAEGVASSAKHFPGHGDTQQDSHHDLPRLPHDLERLRAVELRPFAAYARAGLASVMTAHVVFEALDPGIPATMSRRVLTDLLREELGFGGVIVSDDLEMKAIAERYDLGEATVASLEAGCDAFLVCHRADRQRACIEAVVRAVELGKLPLDRVREASMRLAQLAQRFAQGPECGGYEALSDREHLAEAAKLTGSGAGRDPTEVAWA